MPSAAPSRNRDREGTGQRRAQGRTSSASTAPPFCPSPKTCISTRSWRDRARLLRRYADLGDALGDPTAASADEWRIHFHVPFREELGPLHNTQGSFATF
jgi:hypothetical protein